MDSSIVAFLSYAHEDDRLDAGGVVNLGRALANEFSLLTGEELPLFVDRDILWGEQWSARIEGALFEAAFFIPIMTPRYFLRSECRRECATYHGKVQAAGLGNLMMPILYIPVPDFGEHNDDELVALLSRYQYEDWSELRLRGAGSPEYRLATHKLASRMARVMAEAGAQQLAEETARVMGDDEADSVELHELASDLTSKSMEFQTALEKRLVGKAQHDATASHYLPRIHQSEQRPGQGGVRYALLQRYATEELVFAERELADSLEYNRIYLGLEPLVEKTFRLLQHHPEEWGAFDDFWAALSEAEAQIRDMETKLSYLGEPASAFWKERAHVSKLARQIATIYEEAEARISEVNAATKRWIRERDLLMSEVRGVSSSTD